jgi:hypothetical protein
MESRNLFGYIDNVELTESMKRRLSAGEADKPRQIKSSAWKNFTALGAAAAVVCAVMIGGYMFLMNGNPPLPEYDGEPDEPGGSATIEAMYNTGAWTAFSDFFDNAGILQDSAVVPEFEVIENTFEDFDIEVTGLISDGMGLGYAVLGFTAKDGFEFGAEEHESFIICLREDYTGDTGRNRMLIKSPEQAASLIVINTGGEYEEFIIRRTPGIPVLTTEVFPETLIERNDIEWESGGEYARIRVRTDYPALSTFGFEYSEPVETDRGIYLRKLFITPMSIYAEYERSDAVRGRVPLLSSVRIETQWSFAPITYYFSPGYFAEPERNGFKDYALFCVWQNETPQEYSEFEMEINKDILTTEFVLIDLDEIMSIHAGSFIISVALNRRVPEVTGVREADVIINAAAFEIPQNPHHDRDFWYFQLWGRDYIVNLYSSLKYHASFARFEPDFEPLFPELFRDGIASSESIMVMVRDYLSGNYYERAESAILCTLEQFCFNFLESVGMPEREVAAVIRDGWSHSHFRHQEQGALELALRIAQAFAERDTRYLNGAFYSFTDNLFDFVRESDFSDTLATGITYDAMQSEFITTIRLGGEDWLLYTDPYYVMQFTPAGREVNRIGWQYQRSDLVMFCYLYAAFSNVHEETNLVLRGDYSDRTVRPSDEFYSVSTLYNGMYSCLLLFHESDYREGGIFIDRFAELADYVFGVEVDIETMRQVFHVSEDGERVLSMATGISVPWAELISETRMFYDGREVPVTQETWNETEGSRRIIIEYYGDTGYMFPAKMVEYELLYEEMGWRLAGVTTIRENPDVNVSFFHP